MLHSKPVGTVFLAEDDEDDVEIFKELLASMPERVHLEVAANGVALIQLLQKAPVLPDMVFLDMNMPIKNGIQCLQEIKAHQQWKHICIVVLSTSSNPEQIELAQKKGADFYMVKSTSFTQFQQALTACLKGQVKTSNFVIGLV